MNLKLLITSDFADRLFVDLTSLLLPLFEQNIYET
jgi:hypothetical protein